MRARAERVLTDRSSVALAAAVGLGAWCASPLPLWPLLAAVGGAVVLRRPWLLVVLAALLASCLGARAHAGLAAPRPGPLSGTVRLLTDAVPDFGGVSAEVRLGHRHLELEAHGQAASALRSALAGQRFRVTGVLNGLGTSASYLHTRHVVARLSVQDAELVDRGGPLWEAANRVRAAVEHSVAALPEQDRVLFDGFVLGDRRGQDVDLAADFQGSGLSHLLVVSGENVAFVLALARPLLRRLGLRGRWIATLALILFFATMTRFEPSVLRASVMAGLAATAVLLGRPASGVRLLSLAVAGLVLVDPLLVHSVGFLLSVGATAAIVVLARPLADALGGPSALRSTAAVTLAAELGVAPVAVATFGGIPVAALPANLLAVPAAGLVVVWGLPLGLVGRVLVRIGVPGAHGIAHVLLLPAELLLDWVAGVARRCAALPLGELQWGGALALVGALAVLLCARRLGRRRLRTAGVVLLALALVVPAVRLRVQPPGRRRVAAGVVLWRAGGATVVELEGSPAPGSVLEGLGHAGVRRVDVVIAATGGARDAAVIRALRHRWPVATVLAPDAASIRGARTPSVGARLRVGSLTLTVTAVHPHLQATVVTASGGPRAAPPPGGSATASV